MDVPALHRRATEEFTRRLRGLRADQRHLPTPCTEWDVDALLDHVVGEALWTVPLLDGATIEEVGDRFDGDLLGNDPLKAWEVAAEAAAGAAERAGAMTDTVHLSFGDFPGEFYAQQLFADYLVHSWDLARAIGADEALDAELVEECEHWFSSMEDEYRSAGAIGPRASLDDGSDPQVRLLAAFGRNTSADAPLAVLRRFNDAFGERDIDAVMALMTDDCIFEDTSPPDGGRHVGAGAVRAAFAAFFESSSTSTFATEEGVVVGDRATFRWRYDWGDGHVRGVDVFRVRNGKVAEKLSYVKG